jgi:outer membrane murein-binding lipoprotein Lpp
MQKLSFFSCLLLLWTVVIPQSDALTIDSERTDLVIIEGVLHRNLTLQISCTTQDINVPTTLTLTREDGTVSSVRVECLGIKYVYEQVTVGYVPHRARRYLARVCSARDGQRTDVYQSETFQRQNLTFTREYFVNQTNISSTHFNVMGFYDARPHASTYFEDSLSSNTDSEPRHRLMSANVESSSSSSSSDSAALTHKHKRKPMIFPVVAAAVLGGVLVAGGAGLGTAAFAMQMTDRNKNDRLRDELQLRFNDLERAMNQFKDSKNQFYDEFQNYVVDNGKVVNETVKSVNVLRDTVQNQRASIDNLERFMRLNGPVIQQLQQDVQQRFNSTAYQFNELQSAVSDTNAALSALSSQVNQDIRYAFSTTFNVTSSLAHQTRASFKDTQEILNVLKAKVDQITVGLRDLTSLVYRSRENIDVKMKLADEIQAQIQAALNDGFNPFLADAGKRPFSGSTSWYVLVDSMLIRQRILQQGVDMLVFRAIDWYCSAYQITEKMKPFYDGYETMASLGPSDCNPLTTSNCSCYMASTVRFCPVQPSKVDVSEWESYGSLNSSVCASVITTLPTQYLMSITDVFAMMTETCNQDPVSETVLSSSTLQMIGRTLMHPNSTDISCDYTYNGVMSDETKSFAKMFITMLQETYQTMWALAPTVLPDSHGVLPNNLKIVSLPYERLNNVELTCVEASFAAFSPELIPMSRLIPREVTSMVSVRVDNEPEQLITNNRLSVLEDYRLFTERLVIGDLVGPKIYDVPESELSASPIASTAAGKIGYVMVSGNASAEMNLPYWLESRMSLFDPEAAVNQPVLYERRTNSDGTCAGDTLALQGGMCNMLESFKVVSSTNEYINGNGYPARTLTFQPRSPSATLTANIVIPQGQVARLLFSSCPVVQWEETSAAYRTLHLTNPDGVNAITVDVFVQVPDMTECTQTYTNVLVAAARHNTLRIPVCERNGVPYNMTVVVVRRNSQNQPVVCDSTTIQSNRSAFYVDSNRADFDVVRQTSAIVADTVNSELLQLMSLLHSMIMDNTALQLEMAVGLNTMTDLQVNSSVYYNIMRQSSELQERMNQSMAKTRNSISVPPGTYPDDYEAQSQQIYEQADRLKQRSERLLLELDENVANLTEAANRFSQTSTRLINATRIFSAAYDDYLNATAAFNRAVFDSLFHLLSRNDGGAFFRALADAIRAGAEGVADFVNALGDAIVTLVKAPLGMARELFDNLLAVAMFLVYIFVGYFVIKYLWEQRQKKKAQEEQQETIRDAMGEKRSLIRTSSDAAKVVIKGGRRMFM